MKKILFLLLPLTLIIGFTQCNKDDNKEPPPEVPETPKQVLIGEDFALGSGLKVAFYADTNLFVGYNQVYFTVKDSASGDVVTSEEFTLFPKMEMNTGMVHSCPNEAVVYDSELKQYLGAITFVMSSAGGTWTVSVTVAKDGNQGTVVFSPTVENPAEAKLYSFPSMLDSSATYFVTLIHPANPKVGENDFEVLVNYKASMMEWPAVEDFMIEIEPEMPDMGHGSPNNVNPVHIKDGHYLGLINFTMTGWWRVNMTIKDTDGNVLNDDRYFDITFQ